MSTVDVTGIVTEILYGRIAEDKWSWIGAISVTYPGSSWSHQVFYQNGNSYRELTRLIEKELTKFSIVKERETENV